MHGFIPRLWAPKLYQLNSKLWLRFFSRVNKGEQYFDAERPHRYVSGLEEEWIVYDMKHSKERNQESDTNN